jgi:long-chain acyl-CoA synthetase
MSSNERNNTTEPPVWWSQYGPGVETRFQPLKERSLGELLRNSARDWPRHTAFSVCLDNGLAASRTFAAVDAEAEAFAAYLRGQLGLAPGDRVAVQVPNSLGYPVAAFGALRAEGILVNINPLYTAREMHHQLADSGARVLIIADLFAHKVADAIEGTAVEAVVTVSLFHGFPGWKRYALHALLRYAKRQIRPQPRGGIPMARALADGRQHLDTFRELPTERGGEETAVLQYTGGTTGTPKGAELSHNNLLANISQTYAIAGPLLRPGEDVVLTALPLYHIFAFTFNLLIFYSVGCHSVLCPTPRPPSKLRAAFERYPITKFAGVNALFQGLLREPWFRESPPAHLDFTVAGGTALQTPVGRAWQDVVGSPIHEGYGLSETSPVVAVNPPGGEIRPGTIGVPIPGTQVCLFDEDGDDVTSAGGPGELAVRGPQVMKGYWNQPEATATAFRGDWFLTGDIATQDEQGYLRIVDRKKDMIDVSGFNVYPNEVEAVLITHPAITEVGVVGVPHPDGGGEHVRAVVVSNDPELTQADVIAWAKKSLTNYKCPDDVLFRDELPKTAVGKVLRKELRTLSDA